MTLKELFQHKGTVMTDGAMGTYFSKITGLNSSLCEKYNTIDPDIIRRIHTEYIDAGAKIIRTNTFSANTQSLNVSKETLAAILIEGYHIAEDCADGKAVVCADVSVIYNSPLTAQEVLDEYQWMIDTFLSCGAQTFLFETLPDIETAVPAIDYILSVCPNAEIVTSFTVLPDGRTRSGLSVNALLQSIEQHKHKLTAVGLNCGCGALQLFPHAVPFFSYIQQNTDLYTMVMPNAGYPSIENNRTVFTSTPSYFAEQTSRFIPYGISAVGGCCGTEPSFIRTLSEIVKSPVIPAGNRISYKTEKHLQAPFSSQLTTGKFIIAAELDPPNTSDLSKMISAAKILKDSGVNIITISDSPLGHAKTDPVICSARIKREAGIDILPHICCRDRNINALRSILLGAHSEGIRAVLAVTGDHIAETDRGIVKPVFNIDSTRLMELISQMNNDVFSDAPIAIGGAYDPDPRKTAFSLKRLDRKISCGAKFLLTQPVFSEEAINSIRQARQKGVKVLAGIMPMVSYRNAHFMKNEVPGMSIPDELVARFRPDMTREQAAETGIHIAAEIASRIKPHVDGFYFITPFNRADVIRRVLERIKTET